MPAWRIWAEGRATLDDLEHTWSLDDVDDATDVLAMMAAQQNERTNEAGQ